jgi:hypothetical protein
MTEREVPDELIRLYRDAHDRAVAAFYSPGSCVRIGLAAVLAVAGHSDTDPEKLAKRFHETYERLAPTYDYTTRRESAVPWEDVPAANKELMVATVREVFGAGVVGVPAAQPANDEATIHETPAMYHGLMPCCGKTPFEVPGTDRITANLKLVTCGGSGLVMQRIYRNID